MIGYHFNIVGANGELYDFPPGDFGCSVYQPLDIPSQLIPDPEGCSIEVEGCRIEFSYEPSGITVDFQEPYTVSEERALEIVQSIGRRLAAVTGQGAYLPEYDLLIAPATSL